jgi:hypothetical protein
LVTGFRSTLPTAPDRVADWGGTASVVGSSGDRSGLLLPGGRRRSVPHLVAGALLVVACAAGFAIASARTDHRAAVLMLARPVTAGQQLGSGELRSVRVAVEAGVATIPASQLSDVVGHTVEVSLPAGALLTSAEVGAPQLPAGQAVVAVAVKPGQAPPDLQPGDHVLLVPASTNPVGSGSASADSPSAGSGLSWAGTVITVVPPTGAGDSTVVAVQLAQTQARAVGALQTGQVDLVLVNGQ